MRHKSDSGNAAPPGQPAGSPGGSMVQWPGTQRPEALGSYLSRLRLAEVAVAPVIYGLIVPLVLLDLGITIYQHVGFRAYGIERVRRRDYIRLDRHRLPYLNWLQGLNCAYCGYANGLAGYYREIAARTERYFCPIRFSFRMPDPHGLYDQYGEYGDAAAFRARVGDKAEGHGQSRPPE